jgi:plastocyanin
MDPMKSRRWIAAAALAAAVVFLVMVTGEHGPAAPPAPPTPVSSSGTVLASGGDPSDKDGGDDNGGGQGAALDNGDREEVIGALQGLLDALGISPDELADGGENSGCGNGNGNENGKDNGNGNGNGNGGDEKNNGDDKGNGEANGGCEQSEPAASGQSAATTITIKGFSFGQPVTVAPGATVEVVNTDAAPHNVTAADDSFKTANLNQDEKATFKAPTAPGRYEFTCTIHPEMTGTLIVEAGGGQGGSRSSEPANGSQRGGDHNGSGHQSTGPGREDSGGGSSNGY